MSDLTTSTPDIALAPLDIAIVLAYFAAVGWVGYRAVKRQTGATEDFLLAGRRLTLPMFVATLVSSWYGGILGVGEFSYKYGLSQWVVFGIPYYVFALIFAFFLAEKVQKSPTISIPDRLRMVYGSRAGELGAVFTFLMSSPAPYMLMTSVLLGLIFGTSPAVGMALGTLASTLYLIHGGFRSVTATNYLEFVLMYGGFFLILPCAVYKLGGPAFLTSHLPALHLTWHGGNSVQYILVWFFIALWTLSDPGFHQRCEAAQTPAVARNGILVSVGFWFLFDAMTVTTGLYARAALPELQDASLAYPALAAKVLPTGFLGLFYVGMLATVMSTLVSNAFMSGQTLGRDLLWRLLGGDEIRSTRYGLVLAISLATLLAWQIPSVVDLWYSLGSVMGPGLLLPLLLSYAPHKAPSETVALTMMGSGSGLSVLWMAHGRWHSVDGSPQWLLGIEPVFPGLMATLLIWLVARGIGRGAKASDSQAPNP